MRARVTRNGRTISRGETPASRTVSGWRERRKKRSKKIKKFPLDSSFASRIEKERLERRGGKVSKNLTNRTKRGVHPAHNLEQYRTRKKGCLGKGERRA